MLELRKPLPASRPVMIRPPLTTALPEMLRHVVRVVKLRKPLSVREPTGFSPFGPASPAPMKSVWRTWPKAEAESLKWGLAEGDAGQMECCGESRLLMSDNVALVMRSFEAMRAWDVDALLQLYH